MRYDVKKTFDCDVLVVGGVASIACKKVVKGKEVPYLELKEILLSQNAYLK